MVCEVAEAPKAEFDPELLKHYEQAGLQYALCGGVAAPNHFVYFAAAMAVQTEWPRAPQAI